MLGRKGWMDLPVQYTVAIVVAVLAITMLGYFGYELWKNQQMDMATSQIYRVVNEAEIMCAQAGWGTNRTIKISLPSAVEKVVFGSQNCTIFMKWKEKRIIYCDVKFVGKNGKPATIYGGKITLNMRVVGGNCVEVG